MKNEVAYNQVLSLYGPRFHARLVSIVETGDVLVNMAAALQLSEWVSSILTNSKPNVKTFEEEFLGLGGAKDFQSKEGNFLTPRRLLKNLHKFPDLIAECRAITKKYVRRPNGKPLPLIISDMLDNVETDENEPDVDFSELLSTYDKVKYFCDIHNSFVEDQQNFMAEKAPLYDDRYEAMYHKGREEINLLSDNAKRVLAAFLYYDMEEVTYTKGQVQDIAKVSVTELDESLEDLVSECFISRDRGENFSSTRLFIDHVHLDDLEGLLTIPSSDLSDLDWREAIVLATLYEMAKDDENLEVATHSFEVVEKAFRGRYSSSGGIISSAFTSLEHRGFISIRRNTKPYVFTVKDIGDVENIFSVLDEEEYVNLEDVLLREPVEVAFPFEVVCAEDVREDMVRSLISLWKTNQPLDHELEAEAEKSLKKLEGYLIDDYTTLNESYTFSTENLKPTETVERVNGHNVLIRDTETGETREVEGPFFQIGTTEELIADRIITKENAMEFLLSTESDELIRMIHDVVSKKPDLVVSMKSANAKPRSLSVEIDE